MWNKLYWSDLVGIIVGWLAVLALVIFFIAGKIALLPMLIVIGAVFMFTLLIYLAAKRADDNPDNDTVTDAVSQMGTDAKAAASDGWSRVTAIFTTSKVSG